MREKLPPPNTLSFLRQPLVANREDVHPIRVIIFNAIPAATIIAGVIGGRPEIVALSGITTAVTIYLGPRIDRYMNAEDDRYFTSGPHD